MRCSHSWKNTQSIARAALLLGLALFLVLPSRVSAATVGTVVPILGQPASLAYDATRKLLFIANFTDNKIEVYSVEENQIKASIPVGRRPVGIDLVPGGNLLLVCNSGETFLTLIDLNTLKTAGTIPVTPRSFQAENPFTVVVRSASEAVLSTNSGAQLVDIVAKQTTPVTDPAFSVPPNARLIRDDSRQTVFGQGGSVAFRYDPAGAQFGVSVFPDVRGVEASALFATDPTGSRLMIGTVQFDRQLFQTARLFPTNNGQPLPVAGSAFSHDGVSVYLGINRRPAEVQVRAKEGLRLISSFQVPEPITGNMIVSPSDEFLFAISESGVTVVDLNSLVMLPSMSVSSKSLHFIASVCDLEPLLTQTVEITGSGEGSFSWTASTTVSAAQLSSTSGSGDSTLEVNVDPSQFRFLGTAFLGAITISSEESIRGDQTVFVYLSRSTPDQIGTLFPVEGRLSDLVVDENRQRIYLVNSSENRIEVFSISQNTFLPPVDVGSIPKSIVISPDGNQLWIGRLGAESIMVLDADSLGRVTELRIPYTSGFGGTVPFSVARGTGSSLLVAAAPARSIGSGTMYRINPNPGPTEQRVAAFPDLAGSANSIDPITQFATSANGGFVMSAQRNGTVHLYNVATGNFIVGRSLGVTIAGNAAASADGSWFHAGGQVLSSVLVAQDPIPSTISVRSSVTGFAFASLGSEGYRGIRPDPQFSGVPPGVAPRIEKVDASTLEVVSDFAITGALAANSSVPAFAVSRQLAVNRAGTVLYGITDTGLLVVPIPNVESSSRPAVNSGGVVNAASFAPAPSPVAPGSIASVFGTSLSTEISNASSLPLPIVLGGVCVTFEGVAAPIISTSPFQLNVQVPWELGGLAAASVVVSGDGFESRPQTVNLASSAPGVFSFSNDGRGPGAILHANYSPVSVANPARIGETVLIYATGLGATTPAIGTGLPAPSGYQSAPPTVELGGVSAAVVFSGLAPGFVGLYQVNIRIPSNAQIGTNVPVVVRMGTRASNQTTLAIVPATP